MHVLSSIEYLVDEREENPKVCKLSYRYGKNFCCAGKIFDGKERGVQKA